MTCFTPLADLLAREKPLLLPVAHDALSARMIERAGFAAAAIGGFGIIGCRTGLPDLGLASFGEISTAVRDIAAATGLPLIVDGDDGYGDVKNVVRTLRTYEEMGISALVLEDQVSPKKCGHAAVTREVVPVTVAEKKIAAAVAARRRPDLAIIARTDARLVEGLDAAIDRGHRYIAQGADALFVEAPTSVEELERIGRSFTVPLIVNAAEGGRTPVLTPEQYRELGFSIILYPATLLLRMVGLFERTLAALRRGEFADEGPLPAFQTLTSIMDMDAWMEIDRRHA
ncbi:isocitrate lyase/PEP mutase family protein [Niveispirillum fermenti]|uniref:isocitrate lyase/PEP mutase family protein n=1 Tax=Niveispirillum fermenti TaxID=1233113 RepID=UPI003A877596